MSLYWKFAGDYQTLFLSRIIRIDIFYFSDLT